MWKQMMAVIGYGGLAVVVVTQFKANHVFACKAGERILFVY